MKHARHQASSRHSNTMVETLESRCLLTMTWAHPAVLHTANDLEQMKARLNVEPWRSGYMAFAKTPQASISYAMEGPFTVVGRDSSLNLDEYDDDMLAVYYQAIQWSMTGNAVYAQKAIQIIDAWTTTQTSWSGSTPGMAAGYNGKYLAEGAEILRYTYPGWTNTETTNIVNYFNNMVWPVIGGDSTGLPKIRDANQGAMELDGAIALSIFSEDETKFRQSVDAYINSPVAGIVDGSLPTGQFSDFGRDQTHAGGMLGDLGLAAEMAWNQNIDLYGVLDNRLLKMAEYYTKYNLGYDVPYTQFGAAYGVYTAPGPGRGIGNAYELIASAYTTRKGLPAPYTVQYNTAAGVSEATFLYKKDWTSTLTPAGPLPVQPSPDAPLPAPLPATSLTNVDVGAVGIAGTGTYNNGTWTLTGAGAQMWNTSDSFHFAYQTMTGDGSVIARVTGNTGTYARANAGVMMRATLTNNSPMIHASIDPPGNPGVNGSETFYRATAGATTGEEFHEPVGIPSWVKVERRGNHFISYDSPDGITWTPLRHMYSNMPATIYVGLVACSHDTTKSMTATFTNVSMGSGVSSPPPAPTGLSAKPGNAKVTLNWVSSYSATAYNLRRATTSGGPYTTIASGLTGTTYTDLTAANGTTYYYTVAATKNGQQSSDSAAISVTPAAPLARPTGLTATGVSPTRINLAWTASAGAWFYNVQRATVSGGPYTTIANGIPSTTFVDTLPPKGTSTPYYYIISAVNAAGQSVNSAQATANTSATPISTSVAQPEVSQYDIAQLNFSGGTNNGNNFTDKGVGQSFLTLGNASGYDLGAIVFKGADTNSIETNATLTVRVNAINGSTLTTIATLSGTWSHLDNNSQWVTVSFASSPVHLNPNTRYEFDVKRTGTGGYFGLATGTGDPYSGGAGAYMGTTSNSNPLTTTTFTARGYDQTFIVKLKPAGGTNQPPTIVQAASVVNPVNGTSAALSVLGADDYGESTLTYTWSLLGTPPAPVTFSANGTNAAKSTTAGFTKAGTYTFLVTITDAIGVSTTSSVTTTVNLGLFGTSVDVGLPATPGALAVAGQTYTVSAGGADIGGASDEFRFAYNDFTGPGAITARVTGTSDTDANAKAGVMFRSSSAVDAAYAFIWVSRTNQVIFETRAADGATVTYSQSSAALGTAPWVRLVRSGTSTFTASYSTDGTTWIVLGTPQTVTMPDAALVGLAVTSHNAGALDTSSFDQVAISTPPAVQSFVANDGSAQRSMVNSVTVNFTVPVILGSGAIAITRRSTTGGAATPVPFVLTPASGSNSQYVLTFTGSDVGGGSLADGINDLTVTASGVTTTSGPSMSTDQTLTFHRFFGDSDGDRDVDATDSRAFRSALDSVSTSSNYRWWFDADADGDIDATDSRAFRARLDTTL